jgi:hypothetical protein
VYFNAETQRLSAAAIACFSDQSRKDFDREITEGQKRGGAADKQNSMGLI